jgi:hypothetical protein
MNMKEHEQYKKGRRKNTSLIDIIHLTPLDPQPWLKVKSTKITL